MLQSSDLSPVSRHRRRVNNIPIRAVIRWIDEKSRGPKDHLVRASVLERRRQLPPIVHENKRNRRRLFSIYDRGSEWMKARYGIS